MTRPQIKPKACPWCGAKAQTDAYIVTGYGWVYCGNTMKCCAQGPARKTRNGAIRAWNRISLASSGARGKGRKRNV